MRWVTMMLAMMLVVAWTSSAGAGTGTELLLRCEGREGINAPLETLLCTSYLLGYIDAYKIITRVTLRAKQHTICLPDDGLQGEQARLIVTKWLRDNPDELHESERVLIWLALRQAFPCGRP